MSRLAVAISLLTLSSAVALASVFQDHSFSVARAGSEVEIVWSTVSETGVVQFEIHRKTANATDWDIVCVQKPMGVGYQYHWTDETAFKTTDNLYQYFVRAVFSDGSREDTPVDRTVSGSTSGVRRTWGSIKAMFR